MKFRKYDKDIESDEILPHTKMLNDMKNHYRYCNKVEFSYTNNYVIMDGVCYNGVSKEIFENITKGISFENGKEPEFVDWKNINLR